MALERRHIREALLEKGFFLDTSGKRDHDRFEYVLETTEPVYTVLSRGTKDKTYHDGLLARVKKQLLLDSKAQLLEFVACPLTKELYREYLYSKGVVPAPKKPKT